MSISLANETPSVEQKGLRANFRWTMAEPWDERRLAAFLMTKHRRSDSDWTRRPSPFFATLGQSVIECSVPVARPEALAELASILTSELKGILVGANRIYDQMTSGQDWKSVSPP
ncbi:MAG TPA: hypothetical protein VGL03_06450 [Thermoanaerobaculia bacterium]|jgi:hypothetical protein